MMRIVLRTMHRKGDVGVDEGRLSRAGLALQPVAAIGGAGTGHVHARRQNFGFSKFSSFAFTETVFYCAPSRPNEGMLRGRHGCRVWDAMGAFGSQHGFAVPTNDP